MPKREAGGIMRKVPRKKERAEGKSVFKVKSWSGDATPFSKGKFRRWLVNNLGVSEVRARRVTKELLKDYYRTEVVEPTDLILKASSLAISLPYSRGDIMRLPAFPGVFAQMKPLDIVKDAGGDIIGGVIDAGKDYYGGKWKPEDGSTKETLEFGGGLFFGDDGTAPHLDFSWDAPLGCCTRRGVPGIKIPITVSATDDSGNLGNDSGVDTLEINGYGPTENGRTGRTQLGKWDFDHWEEPDPNNPDEDSPAEVSEDDTVEFDDELCIPCNLIKDGSVLLQIIVKDKDGNKQIEYKTIPFSKETLDKCCS